jgi:hypothetical protein
MKLIEFFSQQSIEFTQTDLTLFHHFLFGDAPVILLILQVIKRRVLADDLGQLIPVGGDFLKLNVDRSLLKNVTSR